MAKQQWANSASPVLIDISEPQAGQRLDNFLLARLKGVPKSHIYRIVRRGEVRVNKGRVKPETRLVAGDVVRIPPIRTTQRLDDLPLPRFLENLTQRVIHEDEHLLVLDKPAGVAVHAGTGIRWGVIEILRFLRQDLPFLELCHRLDRETSGCLILAKHREAMLALHRTFRRDDQNHETTKSYFALVQGHMPNGRRLTRLSLSKTATAPRTMYVDPSGHFSESVFVSEKQFSSTTLVNIQLITGRTHQARVHAAHIGHPIAGDKTYGDSAFNKEMRVNGLDRLFLHAARLVIRHPIEDKSLELEIPLPPDLRLVLDRLA